MRVNVNGSSKNEFENKNTLLGAEATSPDYIVRPSVKQLQITPLEKGIKIKVINQIIV